jgi:hypothetical protein
MVEALSTSFLKKSKPRVIGAFSWWNTEGGAKKKTQGLSWVRGLSSFDICLCDVSRTDFFLRGEALVFQLENIEDETSQE